MRIDHFEFLVHVAETGSITQSAENLHITQQGLSQAIQSLEKQLGVTLLNRSVNGISLTEEGEKTIEKAKDILLKYEDLLTELKPYIQAKAIIEEELTIYSSSLISTTILRKIINTFRKKHSNTNITVVEQKPVEIINEIKNKKSAIGIINPRRYILNRSLELLKPNIVFEKFFECGVYATVSKTSPIATNKLLTTKELIKYPIVVFNAEQHIEMIHNLFREIGNPHFKVKTTNRDIYLETIAEGSAIGISNCFPEKLLKKRQLVNVPIETSNAFNLVFGCLTSADQPLTYPVKDLIKTTKNILSKEYFLNPQI